MPSLPWFDAHLDLAYLAACGRDMSRPTRDVAIPHPPCAVTLASLSSLDACLGTIFVVPNGKTQAVAYDPADPSSAARAGRRQMEIYAQWRAEGKIGGWTVESGPESKRPSLGILMEGADPILSPDELPWWRDGGLVAIGLSWTSHSRYAGGNDEARGLTQEGRDLVAAMDAMGLVHDVSHLSDRSFDELCMKSDATIMASHSNCRALLHDGRPDRDGVPAFQRHLSDAQIREIARRGGVIGVNLYSPFLDSTTSAERPSADLSRAVDHIQHVCDVTGSTRCVGLGSDMDGGFSAAQLPRGIHSHADLHRLAEELASRRWSPEDVARFTWGNWAAFWQRVRASSSQGTRSSRAE